MGNFEHIDKLFGPPASTTLKGTLINNKGLICFGLGTIVGLILLAKLSRRNKRIQYIKKTESKDPQDLS